jgi:hypothetical protein
LQLQQHRRELAPPAPHPLQLHRWRLQLVAVARLAPFGYWRCSLWWPGLLPLAANTTPYNGPAFSLRLLGLLPTTARLAPSPFGCRACSLRRPDLFPTATGLVPAMARLAPSGCRACSLQWPGLLPPDAGVGRYDGSAFSLRLPALLPAASRVPDLLPSAIGAAPCGGRCSASFSLRRYKGTSNTAMIGVVRPEATVLDADVVVVKQHMPWDGLNGGRTRCWWIRERGTS